MCRVFYPNEPSTLSNGPRGDVNTPQQAGNLGSSSFNFPVNQKARNLLADVETKVAISQRERATTVKIIGIAKAHDKSRPLLSRFVDISKQSCSLMRGENYVIYTWDVKVGNTSQVKRNNMV
ncbi:hypothetical protein YC2023_083642 [Brassica napus]